MDLYYKQEVTVGILVIVAISVFVGGLMWLSGRSLSRGVAEVEIRFTNGNGLAEGDPVQVSGHRIGRVTSVELEEVGRIAARISVPDRWRPRADAAARITSLDFLGAKAVDYTPGTSSEMLGDGVAIVGTLEPGILDGAAGLTDQVSSILTGLQGVVGPRMSAQLMRTFQAAEGALRTIESVGDGPVVAQAQAALTEFVSIAQRLDTLLAKPALGKSVDDIEEVMADLKGMTEQLAALSTSFNSVIGKIDRGEGTLGLAVNDTTLHHDVHELLTSMTELLDDMRERPTRYFRLTVF
jgi:phospholipid/cholesterol/gamma-HCH transport system substrate-binding protein